MDETYAVGCMANVVLYREHLDSGQLAPDERVPEQAGVHPTSAAPTPLGSGATIDGQQVHSNLHIGERIWETDPRDDGDDPSPEYALEIDYYSETPQNQLHTRRWEAGIEQNYRLYGIEVDVIRDDTQLDYTDCTWWRIRCADPSDGFGLRDIAHIETENNDGHGDEWMLVADRAGGFIPGGAGQTGINFFGRTEQAIFTDGHNSSADLTRGGPDFPASAVQNATYNTPLQMFTAKTVSTRSATRSPSGKPTTNYWRIHADWGKCIAVTITTRLLRY